MAVQSLNFLPKDLRKSLKPFQKEGIRYGIAKNGRCLIGDEMGLGKTLQALSIAYYYKADWPMLIIVPSSLKYTWVDEIEKWLPEVPPEDINLIKSSSDLFSLKTAKINIISYGLISLRNNLNAALIKGIKDAKIGVGIVDESHFIKNRQTTRTKKILELLKQMDRVILLTGTPSLARPEELFSQINAIRPGLVGNWQYFGERYCEGHFSLQAGRGGKMYRTFDTRGASNLKELHEILKSNLMIRRLKQDVLTELPAKRRQRISFDIGQVSERKKALEKSLKSFKSIVTRYKKQLTEFKDERLVTMQDVSSAMTVLFKDTGLAKAGAIQEYISDLLDGMPNKFIVFCYHLNVISAVTEILAKRNIRYVRIAGDVPPEIRANYVKEFQNNPNCRVAVLSITASCMGITLTAADHVVFAELHWTPGVIKQAEDRCHRIGQKNAVQIHFLTARGTIDDLMWSMLSRKLTVTSETLDGEAQLLTADDGDHGLADLLSLCEAWIPDDNDDDVNLFTPKPKKGEITNQQDIRACFTKSSEKLQKGIKRKIRNYYEQGFKNLSDSSDREFKAKHKRSRITRIEAEKKDESRTDDVVHLIIDSDDDCDQKHDEKPFPSEASSENSDKAAARTDSSSLSKDAGDGQNLRSSDFPALDLRMESGERSSCPNELSSRHGRGEKEVLSHELHSERNRDFVGCEYEQSEKEPRQISTEETKVSVACIRKDVTRELNQTSADGTRGEYKEKEPTHKNDEKYLAENASEKSKKGNDTTDSVRAMDEDNTFTSIRQVKRCIALKDTPSLHSNRNCPELTSDYEVCNTSSPLPSTPLLESKMTSDVTDLTQPDSKVFNLEGHDFDGKENSEQSVGLVSSRERTDDNTHSWRCTACTFDNHEDLKSCEICEAVRPVERVMTRSNTKIGNIAETALKTTERKHRVRKQDAKVEGALKNVDDRLEVTEVKNVDPKTNGQYLADIIQPKIDDKDADNLMKENTSLYNDGFTNIKKLDLEVMEDTEGTDKRCSVIAMSTDSDSSTDMEDDWACNSTSSELLNTEYNQLKKRNDSQALFSTSPRKDGASQAFCVADAFWKRGSLSHKSSQSPRSIGDGLRRSHLNSIQLFSPPGSCLSNDEDKQGIMTRFKSASQLLYETELADINMAMFDDDFNCDELGVGTCEKSSKRESNAGMLQSKKSETALKKDATSDIEICKNYGIGNDDDDDMAIADLLDDDISIIGSEDSDNDANENDVTPIELKFKMSFESDRVYLYSEDENPLGINLRIPSMGLVIPDELPNIFSHPDNLKQLKRFIREWNSLTITKQRQLKKAGYIFKSPLQVYEELKEEKRNEKVKTIAAMIGGTVAEVKPRKKPRADNKSHMGSGSSKSDRHENPTDDGSNKLFQAVDAGGNPICLFCNGRVENGFRAGLLEARFCSNNCREEYLVRSSKSRVVREQLFAAEKGVCQICSFNPHELFARVKALRKKDRRSAIEETHFKVLPASLLNRMIMDPKEGQFWEADHVTAVSEGGGECGLDNYRTLCVPCHREVTKDLKKRLSKERKIAREKADGNSPIEAYFKRTKPRSAKEGSRQPRTSKKDKALSNCDVQKADEIIASLIAKSVKEGRK